MSVHIWDKTTWEKYYKGKEQRPGLRVRYDKAVDAEVKRACKEFCKWLRREFCFPIRVPVYIKASKHIRAMDGDMVSAIFFRPDDRYDEPYIRVAAGDYEDLLKKVVKDNALAAILHSVAHELTHYFQWINDIELTKIGIERQAKTYADAIIHEYAMTREYP